MRGEEVNFAFQVISNIEMKSKTMSSLSYTSGSRRSKESLTHGYLLTHIFADLGISMMGRILEDVPS